jgi:hypothetical protein
MLNAKRYAPMNARDKMPFEVTPIFYKLQRYDAAAAAEQPAAPAANTAAPANTDPAQTTPAPDTTAPAAQPAAPQQQ